MLLPPPLVALALGALLGWLLKPESAAAGIDPRAMAQATLLSLRDEGRMMRFAARFVAVVTSSDSRLGLTARKT